MPNGDHRGRNGATTEQSNPLAKRWRKSAKGYGVAAEFSVHDLMFAFF
jgi:hypothetical protein